MDKSVMNFRVDGAEPEETAEVIRRMLVHLGTGRCTVETQDDRVIVHVYTYRDADLVLRNFGDRIQPHI